MANKIYPFKIKPTDILIQNEGGGGMLMNDQFVSIVGNIIPDQQKLLDDQTDINNVGVQTDVFSSGIFITNVQSNPLPINDLASNNFDSLNERPTTDQVVIPKPTNPDELQLPVTLETITPSPSPPVPSPTPTPSPSPTVGEEGIYEGTFLPATEQEFELFSLDVDEGTSPEKTITSNDETSYKNNVNYGNIIISKTGTVAKDFLPRTSDGAIAPFYNFTEAAKASINTATKNITQTKNGKLGCGAGVSIIYLRATGHGIDYKKPPTPGKNISLTLGTLGIYNLISKDIKNWKARSNWTDAQPGDIILTKTTVDKNGKTLVNGHIGFVIDTKQNNKSYYDIVSNSSQGYTGDGKDISKAGTLQRNYSIKSWTSIATRKGVGKTIAFQFIGNFIDPKTI